MGFFSSSKSSKLQEFQKKVSPPLENLADVTKAFQYKMETAMLSSAHWMISLAFAQLTKKSKPQCVASNLVVPISQRYTATSVHMGLVSTALCQ
ncbi:MAG: hypothetical protein NT123_23600 [Proteobacteria bacterium]|nr:hypothetical protein [Pseudomonadota bacterium]